MHKNIGGFKFGDLVVHRQTAKLNVSPIFLRLRYAILKQKPYNFTTNTQKAYLSAQASSLSAFVISKTHISGQKPCGRQINTKVCVSKSAIFVILVTTFVQTTISRKLFKYSPSF